MLENFRWLGDEGNGPVRPAASDPPWVQWTLTTISTGFMGLFLFIPLAAVFVEAFAKGAQVYFAAITSSEAAAAIRLTLLTAAIVVPLNVTFGLAAAWSLTRFEFPGKRGPLSAGGWLITESRLFSPSPASCWPPSSSPFRSRRAS